MADNRITRPSGRALSILAMDMGKVMSGKNIDDEIEWWRKTSLDQKHPEVQMACWGVATGLKMAKEDFDAGRPQPRLIDMRKKSS